MFSILRLIKIVVTLSPIIPFLIRDWENDETSPHIAKQFRIKLQKLGPTFIKFGQMLSLRYDFIPQGYCEELQKLLDQGEVIPFQQYIKLLEKGLKIKLSEKFRNIDIDPVGSASLAQVHTGYLNDGTKVAVKVLRPNVKRIIKRDIRLLKFLAKILDSNSSFKKFGVERFVAEFERWTLKEINLNVEGQNCDTFRENFKDDSDVKIPKVYWDVTSKTVLTMEFIEGVSVREFVKMFSYSEEETGTIRGVRISRERISEIVTRALFRQILEHGFFHGDPHPANMIITPDDKFVFLDFGIVGEFSDAQIRILSDLILAIAEGDTQKAIKYLIAFDQIEGVENIEQLKTNVEKILSKWRKKKISRFSATKGFIQLITEGSNAGIDWPVEMLLLLKLMATLDGIIQKIFPKYKLFEKFKPHIMKSKQEGIFKDISANKIVAKVTDIINLIAEMPDTASEVLDKLKTGEFQVVTKQDAKSLELKSKSLKVWVLLILNICLLLVSIYLISAEVNYRIYKRIDIINVLLTFNILIFVIILFELFKD